MPVGHKNYGMGEREWEMSRLLGKGMERGAGIFTDGRKGRRAIAFLRHFFLAVLQNPESGSAARKLSPSL